MRAYLLIVLAVYLSALWGWLNVSDATALSFTTLVVANLGLIFANRSWTRTIWSTLRTPNACPLVGHRWHDSSSSVWCFTFRSCVTCFTSRPSIPMTWRSAWREGLSAFSGSRESNGCERLPAVSVEVVPSKAI